METVKKHLTLVTKEDVSYQKELLPIEAVQIIKSTQGTADLKVIVIASNNKDYAVKTVDDGNGFVPATELFCYELANIIDVPTPNYDLIIMRDKSLAFGSVWEGGVHHLKNINDVNDILQGKVKVRDLNLFFSRVYAFDLFINNLDRHFGNYLFRRSYSSLIGLAFDFSRAWYEVGAFDFNALKDKASKTQTCHEMIKENKLYNREIAIQTFDKIVSVSKDKIILLLKTIPDNWFIKEKKEEIINWWGSEEMLSRVNKLKGEV